MTPELDERLMVMMDGLPWVTHFLETVELIEHGHRILPTIEERIAAAYQHLELACSFKGETVAIREMRKHLACTGHARCCPHP